MKTLMRIVCCLIVLALLAGLVAVLSTLHAIPWLTGFTAQMLDVYPWLSLALSIVMMVYIVFTLAFMVFVLVKPTQKNIYTMATNFGRLEITRQSIESAAGVTLQGIPQVKRYAVQVKGNLKPGKVKLVTHIETDGTENFVALGEEIQTKVAQGLENSLQMKPGHVHVKIKKHQMQERTGKQNKKTGIPRVV